MQLVQHQLCHRYVGIGVSRNQHALLCLPIWCCQTCAPPILPHCTANRSQVRIRLCLMQSGCAACLTARVPISA